MANFVLLHPPDPAAQCCPFVLVTQSVVCLLLSDVVGLAGLFSSPFMSPLVRVVVNRKVVVTGRVLVIRRLENV